MVTKMLNVKTTVNCFPYFLIFVNQHVTTLLLCKGYWYLIRMNEKKRGCPESLVSYDWGFQTQPSCYMTQTLKFAY